MNCTKNELATVKFYNNKNEVKRNMIRVFRVQGDNETRSICFYLKVPTSNFNNILSSFYNAQSEKTIFIDNLKVEVVK